LALSSDLTFSFLSQDITPPPTPSPVKVAGKKHTMAASVSDDEGREEQGNDFNQVSIKGCAMSFLFALFSH